MRPVTDPELWRRAEEIFSRVVAVPPNDRQALAARLCGADSELTRRLEELLAEDREERLDDRLDLKKFATGQPQVAERQVGPYRLLQRLGSGGMGSVFEAERTDGEVQQRVAVKLLREPWNGARYGDLLRRERQILARLTHPNIARFLDAGSTPDGSPYIVMELIRGLPLIQSCDARCLGVRDRIRLFLKVCSAVELAHRNLIVHRDLKPGNILVADGGEPKLLDFGIAKLLEGTGEPTRTGERFLTPSYASPEQIQGGFITTATDVYSLGVILYRLLTGVAPSPAGSRSAEEPRLPSLACGDPGAPADDGLVLPPEARAAALGSTPKEMAQTLRGDLDAICCRCLEWQPEARYSSVSDLRQDLHRYLEGQPVRARPQTWRLRTRKFLRRHRAASITVSLGLAALLLFTLSTWIQLSRVKSQRDAAERARSDIMTVTRLYQESLSSTDLQAQEQGAGAGVSIREILNTNHRKIEVDLADQPRLQARLWLSQGVVYSRLGLYSEAKPALIKSVALFRAEKRTDHAVLADALRALGDCLAAMGHGREAQPLLEESMELSRSLGAEQE